MKKVLIVTSAIIGSVFFISGTIDLNNLFNYDSQPYPQYITKDNTVNNPISNSGATLGRVLFYDKILSRNNTIACASCHQQQFAFGDTATASVGVNGTTGRHSMRLVNGRFSNEAHFFWDERALTLEEQTTLPIQDHIEMGFSGTNGDPDLDSLFRKIASQTYYNKLFAFTYGDTVVNETRIQNALAQFIRSIQSFDSKFDAGLDAANNINDPFSNFSNMENAGKNLFLAPPVFDNTGSRTGGGAGCNGCHQAPEFDIIPNTRNNGVIGSFGGGTDLTNTKSPSLRDIFNTTGNLNGPLMHNANFSTLEAVIAHYDSIPNQPGNNNLDPKLRPGGNLQRLNLTTQEMNQIIAFIKTLSGQEIYTEEKWSNPFDVNGNIDIIDLTTSIAEYPTNIQFNVFPVPCNDQITISGEINGSQIRLIDLNGGIIQQTRSYSNQIQLNTSSLSGGMFLIQITSEDGVIETKRILKL
ncbi:T9SS type A sorting domain-containing protein [bacterium SCSIO 12643]|nr:T9SS type A sorting domain-containing protein [bacterium SCSIO 12643]